MNAEYYILTGTLSATLIVLSFLAKYWFATMVKQQQKTNELLSMIQTSLTGVDKDIEYMKAEQLRHHDRLNQHGERIKNLEIKHHAHEKK